MTDMPRTIWAHLWTGSASEGRFYTSNGYSGLTRYDLHDPERAAQARDLLASIEKCDYATWVGNIRAYLRAQGEQP